MKRPIENHNYRLTAFPIVIWLAAFLNGCATTNNAPEVTSLEVPQRATTITDSATDDTAPVTQTATVDTPDAALVANATDASPETGTTAKPTSTAIKHLQETDNISTLSWRADRGHIDSQLKLGLAYVDGQIVQTDFEQARLWFELASMQGDPRAQYELGNMYFNGTGVSKDYLNAREWWIESAINGNDKAQQKLGYLYSEGLGVERDFVTAKNWYLRAANLGNAEAQTLLGSLFHEGNRIPQDYNEAIKWYHLAAKQGHPHAQYTMAILNHDGLGTEKDMIACATWVNVAAANGYPDDLGAGSACKQDLDELSLNTVNQLSEQWIEQYNPPQKNN